MNRSIPMNQPDPFEHGWCMRHNRDIAACQTCPGCHEHLEQCICRPVRKATNTWPR